MNLRKTVDEIGKKYRDRKVVLVDSLDNEIGVAPIIEAHRGLGLQHRAFSLQLYRIVGEQKELLLQQRSIGKPAFPYFWANTCCFNMAPGELYLPRAVSRVKEEMGAVVGESSLHELYKFSYYAPDIEGWCENEVDNVIVGEWSGELKLNPDEAMDSKWIEWGELNKDIENEPTKYVPWFKMIVSDPRFHSVFE